MRACIRGLALLIAACSAAPATALMIPVPLEEITHTADAIVHGRVTNQVSFRGPVSGWIHTDVTLATSDTWKGTVAKGSTIVVRVVGGTVDGIRMQQEHQPTFHTGGEVVLFLEARSDARWSVHHLEQGTFDVAEGVARNARGERMPTTELKQTIARFLRNSRR